MNKVKEKDLPTGHRKVLSLIRHGKANATTVKEILTLVGGTDKEIRKTVQELVVKYGFLIGTSNEIGMQGFYLIENEDERKAAIKNLRGRIRHLFRRVKALRKGDLEKGRGNLPTFTIPD
jgi:hypothetical protein